MYPHALLLILFPQMIQAVLSTDHISANVITLSFVILPFHYLDIIYQLYHLNIFFLILTFLHDFHYLQAFSLPNNNILLFSLLQLSKPLR